jgi:hypothetical protein
LLYGKIKETFDENTLYIDTGLRIQEVHNAYFHEKQRRCSRAFTWYAEEFASVGLLKEDKEGVLIKYYPITPKETKKSGLSTIHSTVGKGQN